MASSLAGGCSSKRRKAVPSVRQGPLPGAQVVARLADLSLPHVESFSFFCDEGLADCVRALPQREYTTAQGATILFWFQSAAVGVPTKADATIADRRLFPSECREGGSTYAAPLHAVVCRRVNGGPVEEFPVKLGDFPIMVRSSKCHTTGLSPMALVERGEEAVEFGGYFILNGIERIIRMLQIPKRNFPMAITRGAYTNRGPLYTNKGVVMRCVRPDHSSITLTLHYLIDGSATVRFAVKRQEFFLPIVMVLKALVATTDREIYERVVAGDTANTYLSDRVLMLLRDAKRYESALHSRDAALTYLGARFRAVLDMPASLSDIEAGRNLIDSFVLVHLPRDSLRDKFEILLLMLRKLYAFVRGDVLEDNADALANQELLVSGHFIQMFMKEKLGEFLGGVQTTMEIQDRLAARLSAAKAAGSKAGPSARKGMEDTPVNANDAAYFRRVLERQPEVGRKLNYLLATGNLVSSSGLDLMQASGFTVVADKINFMRFTTHFRSVHRGAFFAEMKTTTVRKLLPENWGFLCPVHTPDGGPCGLLNHLAASCSVVAHPLLDTSYESAAKRVARHRKGGAASGAAGASFAADLHAALVAFGMTPHAALGSVLPASELPVMLDGRLLGGAAPHTAYAIARALRRAKALTSATPARLDRVGSGKLPGQDVAVCALVRSAALGCTDPWGGEALRRSRAGGRAAGSGSGAFPVAVGGGLGGGGDGARGDAADEEEEEGDAKEGDGAGSGSGGDSSGTAAAALASSGLPVVPASLEVSFIPPPWWEADVDVPYALRAASAASQGGADAAGAGEADADAPDRSALALKTSSSSGGQGTRQLVGPFPGLFLHSTPARLVRPVLQLDTGLVELVTPTEQPFMDIAATPEDVRDILRQPLGGDGGAAGGGNKAGRKAAAAAAAASGRHMLYTHIELSATAMLSEAAALTPFSDLNQSPRNMYQCQMGKQTMGTPIHSWPRRADNKMFRLQNPQAPLVQSEAQAAFGFDEYPNGANAVVAVIAYTGYDMEDACILSKSSHERGFGHASVYKTFVVDLNKDKPAADAGRYAFDNLYKKAEQAVRPVRAADPDAAAPAATAASAAKPRPGDRVSDDLEDDGLPPVGARLSTNSPFYAVYDAVSNAHVITRHKDLEEAFVDEVRVLPSEGRGRGAQGVGAGAGAVQKVSIKLRYNRNPIVGDKFSSRHGQKGVLSYLWPAIDMPFTDSGMIPDVIINPHAFPSRMTIGMLVESMAGKAGAMHGMFQDATPFRFDERNRVVDYFGEQLRTAGYAYHGAETMYSGVTGEPLSVDIYLGVVYYQRLRHMVSDKAQVRATGKVNNLTRQPVKGRKKHGGIRFGEMERDSLLAHGASFLLHDRLMNSSDRHIALICGKCRSLLSAISRPWSSTETSLGSAAGAEGGGARHVETQHLNLSAAGEGAGRVDRSRRAPYCLTCHTGEWVVPLPVPYVFRYLTNELAGMNIKVQLELGAGPLA